MSTSCLSPTVFICISFVYKQHRTKLDPWSLKCVFIGYSSRQGYRWDGPSSHKIFVIIDVTFLKVNPFYSVQFPRLQGETSIEDENLGLTLPDDLLSSQARVHQYTVTLEIPYDFLTSRAPIQQPTVPRELPNLDDIPNFKPFKPPNSNQNPKMLLGTTTLCLWIYSTT